MCGIAGAFGSSRTRELAETMAAAIAHRGPDGHGFFSHATGTLAHRRLSIIDLSDAGLQPMASADGRWVVSFNGEIYNYKELREELAAYPFRTQSDTEVILAAWDAWGEAALDRFLGMFAFAILDARSGDLVVVRDRVGIKPLFYAEHDGRLLFASEIKALLAAGVPSRPNEPMIGDYLVRGLYNHTDETFFEGVRSLPPGHLLRRSAAGTVSVARWWDVAARDGMVLSLSDAEVVEAFRALLDDSLRLHLRSDVPVGINLSSGIDSLSLFFAYKRLGQLSNLSVFTMGFAEPDADESRDVEALARAEGVPFTRVPIGPEVQAAQFRKTFDAMDQPFGGLSTMAYTQLMSAAHGAGFKVLLEGQGVDEILAGYAYFQSAAYADLWRERDVSALWGEAKRLHPDRPWNGLVAIAKKAKRASAAVFQDGSSFLDPSCLKPEWLARMQAAPAPSIAAPFPDALRNALYRDLSATKLPRVLRFNDHLSMAFGIELRVPYLDHRLVEFAFALPARWKIRGGQTKFLLREAMRGLVPEELRTRGKRGQSSPQAIWYKGVLADAVRAELAHPRIAALPFVDAGAVRRSFEDFVRNPARTNSFFFWQVINLAHWYERFA